MSKVSKTLKGIVLGGLIFIAAPQKAEAFGFFPPMPWDFEVDIPGDAGKVVSLLKSTYRKVQMMQSQLNTINLDAIKSGKAASLFKDMKGNYKKFAKGPKVPGKGKMKGVADLGLQEGDLDEAHYYDAFTQLFLLYPTTENLPQINGKKPTYQAVHTAYKHKSNEFKQDMIVDTYLAGRVTEDYLVLVERTLKRLDLCQKKAEGYEPGSSKCVFFGLPFVKVEAEDTSKAPDENSDGNGQLGEAMNNYVVTIVYDRLMRIVEDLTATEAMYRSAKQLDIITPSMPQSSAAQYLPQKYHFAYNQAHEAVYADKIINSFKPSSCSKNGSENCPPANDDVAELKSIEDTELLGKLQPIEDTLNKAVILHNLKVQLPEYKDQFRRYRKAEEIHKRALEALKTSDKCAQGFIKTYGGNPSIWGTGAAVNDYKARTGVSRDLIVKYEQATDKTIIGSNNKCTGYYETCPEGYTLDTKKPCEILDEEGNVAETFPLYACTLDIGSADTGDSADYGAGSLGTVAKPDEMPTADNSTYNDADLLGDSSKADIIDNDNRIKAEHTWQIGKEKMLELTENGTLKFNPWNDQVELQKEYLHQKYRNIELIVKAMDQGIESFKIASAAVDNQDDNNTEAEKIQEALDTIAGCVSFSDAKEKVAEECAVEMEADVTAADCTGDTETGEIVCTKEIEVTNTGTVEKEVPVMKEVPVLDDEGNPTYDENGDQIFEEVEDTEDMPLLDDDGEPVLDEDGNPMYVALLDDKGKPMYDEDGEPMYEQRPKVEIETEEVSTTTTETKECTVRIKQIVGQCIYKTNNTAKLTNGTTTCGNKVALNVPDLSKHFFSDILGKSGANKCSNYIDVQAQNIKEKAVGRQVAQDILEETVQVRVDKDKEIQDFVKAYDKKHQEKKEKLASKKASLGTYNKEINKNTEKKNSAQQEWKNTLDRIAEIDKEILQINERKPYATIKKPTEDNKVIEEPDKKAICAMEIQKLKLAFEKEAISGKSQAEAGANWQIPAECDEEVQKDLTDSLGEDFFKTPQLADYVISMNQRLKDNSVEMKDLTDEEKALINESNKKHVVPEDAQKTIAEAKEIIEANAAKRDVINVEITNLIKEIDADAEEFAKNYLEKANEAQAAVEAANEEYEAFLTEDDANNPRRMINKNAACMPMMGGLCKNNHPVYPSDNLTTTMVNFLGYDSTLMPTIKAKMEAEFTGFNISGIDGDHIIGEAVAGALGIPSGYYASAQEIVEAVKEKIIEKAAQNSADTIGKSDEEINTAMNNALGRIKKVEIALFGENDEGEPNFENPSENKLKEISKHENYGEGKPITLLHKGLVDYLSSLQNGLKGDGATDNIFGIPKGVNLAGDTEYYVTLPARGNNYLNMVACVRDANGKAKLDTDCGAGQDYNAPKRPLLNLPPLREVFFYSPLDYRDTPKENGETPAITHLLNLKYPKDALHKWEYLPETWLYLLARPNLRDDGKYQQTFVERSYGSGHLRELINKNDANNEGFRRLIARAGVYPCKLKEGAIVDIDSDDGAGMRFSYRRSAPEGLELQECKEIALNGAAGTSCYTYNKGKGGICHLMADHGKDGVEDSQTPITSALNSDRPLYENYSELGQIFAAGGGIISVFPPVIEPDRLIYRPLQRSLHEYLLNQEDESNQKNSMERQNIQAATFTRNIFSSFLDAVNAEHSAKRSLDTAKENIKDTVKSLCTQIENARPKTGSEIAACNALCEGKTGDGAIACRESCQQEKVDDCIKGMLEGDGLAKSAEDTNYGVKGEYGKEEYEGINCDSANSNDTYASYFCQLSDWQDELIDKAENGYTDDYEKDAKGNPLKVAGFGEVESDKDADKVEERIKSIKNTFEALEADKLGVVTIMPGMKVDEESVKNAQADRIATRVAEDEGLKSMDNQTQIVPYCPIYINKKVEAGTH